MKINIRMLERAIPLIPQEKFVHLRLICCYGPVVAREPKERYLAYMQRRAAQGASINWATQRFHRLIKAWVGL